MNFHLIMQSGDRFVIKEKAANELAAIVCKSKFERPQFVNIESSGLVINIDHISIISNRNEKEVK